MKKTFLLVLISLFSINSFTQKPDFKKPYDSNPYLTDGILEAVSYSRTRMTPINESSPESCLEIPKPFGIMGLYENGKNYFWETAKMVSLLSNISVEEQKKSSNKQILAFAIAYNNLMKSICDSVEEKHDEQKIYSVLKQLSEIPETNKANFFAQDAQVYEILTLLSKPSFCSKFKIENHKYDLSIIFKDNLQLLKSKKIIISEKGIFNDQKKSYIIPENKSNDYGPAIWNPAGNCNYSSRNGTNISAVTIHTTQGSYSGAISWAHNCNSNISFHYIIRSSDGQVTQLVHESDKAWHVGSQNSYTIGIEHEGWVDNPIWYTQEMYNSSSLLTKDIINSGYGIPPYRTYFGASSSTLQTLGGCTKIKGHQHYSGQTHTDPGINWDWNKYYKLINSNSIVNTINNVNGSFFDTGGEFANYSDDERTLWLLEPSNASNVSITFDMFEIESGYDYLYIYDGTDEYAPLIGSYTGANSPGTINSSAGALFFEFRSDCATTAKGWQATYTSNGNNVSLQNEKLKDISFYPNPITNGVNITNVETELKVSIQDNVGKLVFEKLINKNEYLPLDLPSGNYIMIFDDGENRLSKPFIVSK